MTDSKVQLLQSEDKTARFQLPKQTGFAKWLHSYHGRTRMLIKWALAFAMLAFAYQPIPSKLLIAGSAVAFLGAFLRFWASGVIVKNREIADNGPYALTRNPLYMGTYFIFVGACIWINSPVIFALGSILLYFVYVEIIRQEEEKLLLAFGDSYKKYYETAPRLLGIPKQDHLLTRTLSGFSLSLSLKNKGYEGFGVVCGAYIALIAIAWVKTYLGIPFP